MSKGVERFWNANDALANGEMSQMHRLVLVVSMAAVGIAMMAALWVLVR